MSNWRLRGCPRCHGDVYVEKDNEDHYERCLQCGHVRQIAGLMSTYQKTGRIGSDDHREARIPVTAAYR